MFDLISTLPTDQQTSQEAYNAYWAIATSDNHFVASNTSPIYRFARQNMLCALMRDHALTVTQAIWLYEVGPLCEGPAWGSLTAMVNFGRDAGFGVRELVERVRFCNTCMSNDEDVMGWRYTLGDHHGVTCPLYR